MFDELSFQPVSGVKKDRDLILFSLSTCGFCRKAMIFLESHGFEYRYLHLDTLTPEVKLRVKEQFKNLFDKSLSYPSLIIEGREALVGYVRSSWAEALQVPLDSVEQPE